MLCDIIDVMTDTYVSTAPGTTVFSWVASVASFRGDSATDKASSRGDCKISVPVCPNSSCQSATNDIMTTRFIFVGSYKK